LNAETGMLEVLDSEDELIPQGAESCSRILPYTGHYQRWDQLILEWK